MSHELTRLSSGVTVATEPMRSVRSVALGVWVAVGSRDETDEQVGCAHLLEHLLFKGTARRSARAIAEEIDAIGGELNAFTTKELTCFHARVLDEHLPVAVDVLADIVVHAANRHEDVEAEREVVLSELELHTDTPDELAHAEFADLVLDGHPLGRETLGTPGSLARLDRDTVDGFFRAHYRPGNVVVVAAGAVSHDRLVELVDGHLGDMGRPGGGAAVRVAPTGYAMRDVRVRPRPTEHAHVVLGVPGLPRGADDRWALAVLDTVLGGGLSSRLFQRIREERGLAYSTYTETAAFADGGLFSAYAGTSPRHVEEVLRLLRAELEGIADDVTASEVERARAALIGQTLISAEETDARMLRLGEALAQRQPVVGIDEAVTSIATVDVDDVRAVARRVLGRPRDLVVVGPFAPDDAARFTVAVE